MGEIAEAMLNGTLCEECGDFIDAGSGCPRLCDDCADEGEGGEAVSSSKWSRIEDAKRDYKEAAILAAQHGMTLTRHNGGVQYNLSTSAWVIQLYPGNQRIYTPKKKRGPYLDLAGKCWNLVAAVKAAIDAEMKNNG